MNIPSVADVMASIFGAEAEGDPGLAVYGPCDRTEPEPDPDEPVPFVLTGQAEAALDAVPEAEPEAWL